LQAIVEAQQHRELAVLHERFQVSAQQAGAVALSDALSGEQVVINEEVT
jgi:hypothetical protein